ncbi:MAG TPA: response regulator [Planctomycetes bacterium]|nr:response regulator [Fuerstiella sp.]HIK95288.1 response regulator [Planctomycetota bacterium]
MKRAVKYVGEDRDLVELLKQDSKSRGWQWTEFEAYEELLSYLRSRKQSQSALQLSSGHEFRRWLRDRYAPIVLDLDFDQSGATEIVRNIKRIDAGASLIVVSRLTSLTAYSIAKMDGAEAFHTKPITNLDYLTESIECAFDKIDCWERTLLQLQEHRESTDTTTTRSLPTRLDARP